MAYKLSEYHLFELFNKNILFNVDTMLFYEVTPMVSDLMNFLSAHPGKNPVRNLKKKHPKAELKNALLYLEKKMFLKDSSTVFEKPILKKRYGIRHLELMVTHACNMGCRYCYGAHGGDYFENSSYLYGAQKSGMSFETAKSGVDFLFRESGAQKNISIVFFGGEPLLELDLIKKIVSFIKNKEKQTKKKVRLSLSSNGLLLDQEVVDFMVSQGISCQVSIDGPEKIQDQNRCLKNGKGSYEKVTQGIKRLVSARKGKVPARATLTHGLIDIPGVVDHLLAMGFGSIHIEPDNGLFDETAITQDDVKIIKKQNETMGKLFVKHVRHGRYFNYANFVRHIRQTRFVRERLAHFCGAGRTYFALSQDGDFYPCHRFVGMNEYRMGNVKEGLDNSMQRQFLNLTVDNRLVCSTCWARYLCGGGCWKHAVDKNGGLEIPDHEITCKLIKHTIECAMAINSELRNEDTDILCDLYEITTEPHLLDKAM